MSSEKNLEKTFKRKKKKSNEEEDEKQQNGQTPITLIYALMSNNNTNNKKTKKKKDKDDDTLAKIKDETLEKKKKKKEKKEKKKKNDDDNGETKKKKNDDDNGETKKKKKIERKQEGDEERELKKVKKEESIDCAFPTSRILRIVKSEGSSQYKLTGEALFLVNKATEKFIELFTRDAYDTAVEDKKSFVAYKHLASVVCKEKRMDFLSDFVPEKVTAEKALAEIKPAATLPG